MTAQSYVVVDQSEVSPCVLGIVNTTPKDIAKIIFADIMSEFSNVTQQYPVTNINVGSDCATVEDFKQNGEVYLENFLREYFTFGTFTFIFQFFSYDNECDDIEYRYTIQDVKS